MANVDIVIRTVDQSGNTLNKATADFKRMGDEAKKSLGGIKQSWTELNSAIGVAGQALAAAKKADNFVPTGAYRFGNSGRNILSGPGTVNINASLSRRFRLNKSRALQLRIESFNLPNRVNLGLPENKVDVPTAGSIRYAKSPRTMQIGLRLEF